MLRFFNWGRSLDATIGYHSICFGLEVQKSLMTLQKSFRFSKTCAFIFLDQIQVMVQWSPALRSPRCYGHVFWPHGKTTIHFLVKRTLDITSQIFLAHF